MYMQSSENGPLQEDQFKILIQQIKEKAVILLFFFLILIPSDDGTFIMHSSGCISLLIT